MIPWWGWLLIACTWGLWGPPVVAAVVLAVGAVGTIAVGVLLAVTWPIRTARTAWGRRRRMRSAW